MNAAMNIRRTYPIRCPIDFSAAFTQRKYRAWRREVEGFKVAEGARQILGHVPEASWWAHYAANEDAFSAVVAELAQVAE